jgi:hypothetical protein
LTPGPLVAGLRERDRYHAWTSAQLDAIAPPLATCEAVLSEVFFDTRILTLDRDFHTYRRNGPGADPAARAVVRESLRDFDCLHCPSVRRGSLLRVAEGVN